MDTNVTGCRWLGAARATLTAVAAAATVFGLTFMLRRVDIAIPEARDALLGLLGLALVATAGVLDGKDERDQTPETVPAERTFRQEHEGSFRGW